MKQSFLHIFLLLLLSMTAENASAGDIAVKNEDGVTIYYKSYGNNELMVTYRDNNYNSYSGNVVIPDKFEYNGTWYKVTTIGDNAFLDSPRSLFLTLCGGSETIRLKVALALPRSLSLTV